MNIAICCPRHISLDPTDTSTFRGGGPMMTFLAAQGHRITCYTKIAWDNVPEGYDIRVVPDTGIQQGWKHLQDDEDVLIIIAGTWGDAFMNRYTPDVCNILALWEGPVIYVQDDPKLYMLYNVGHLRDRLDRSCPSPSTPGETINQTDLLHSEVERTWDNITDVCILTNGQNLEETAKRYAQSRSPYWKPKDAPFNLTVEFLDISQLEAAQFLTIMEPNDEGDRCVYVGNYRPRIRNLRRLIEDSQIPTEIYGGGWSASTIPNGFENVSFMDKIAQKEVQGKYNVAWYTVVTGDKGHLQTSAITMRQYEALYAGCLTFFDSQLFPERRYRRVDDFFYVDDGEDIQNKLLQVDQVGVKEVAELEQEQFMSHTDVEARLKELESVLEKYSRRG